MIQARLLVKNPGGESWEGRKTMFVVLPRVGENVDLDVDDVGYSYRVVAVHHPASPTHEVAADVYAVQAGKTEDELRKLFDDAPVGKEVDKTLYRFQQ